MTTTTTRHHGTPPKETHTMSIKNIREEMKDFWRGEGEYSMHPLTERGVNSAVDLFLERNIAIPCSELPAVKRSQRDPNEYSVDGVNVVFTSLDDAHKWVMAEIAVWDFIAHEASVLAAQEAEKRAARTKRRDELLREFKFELPHLVEESPLARAINKILDLEDTK